MVPCLQCGSELDDHDGINTRDEPRSGDVTLCAHCGQLAIFTEGGGLRLPTDAELDSIFAERSIVVAYAALIEADTIDEAIRAAREAHARLS